MPAETHLLAGALTNYADDEGYFNANPGLVRAGTHPLRKDATPIEEQLLQLEKVGYLEMRRCTDGKAIGLIVNFAKHQRVSHPSESRLRGRFDEGSRISPELYEKAPEVRRPEQGAGSRELSGEQGAGSREASTADAVPPGGKDTAKAEQAKGAAVDDRGKVLGTLPLNDGSDYEIRDDDLRRDSELYPAVDVKAAYREMKGFFLANPKQLKTRGGIRKHMHWRLAGLQDKAGQSRTNGGADGRTHGNSGNGVGAAEGRRAVSHDAIGAAGARRYGVGADADDGGDPGAVCGAGATGRDSRHVPGGVGGDGAAVRAGSVSGCAVEGDTG